MESSASQKMSDQLRFLHSRRENREGFGNSLRRSIIPNYFFSKRPVWRQFCSVFLIFLLSFSPVVVLSETNQASVGAILQKAILEPEKLNSSAVPPKSDLENLSYKISSATGIAISPLVVAGCLGCYHWWVASSEERSQLNIFYQPYAWGTFLGLGLLFLINSFIGTIIPFLKKPMDFVETIEHTVSGLLIGLPLILLMNLPADFQLAASTTGTGQVTAGFVPSFLATDSWFSTALTLIFWVPMFGVCFFSVWALSQFLNLLILLSPWGGIDLVLRTLKGVILVAILGSALISPWLALFLCSLIIVVSMLMLHFTYRACRFIFYLTFDLLMACCSPKKEISGPVRAYALTKLGKVKKRALGKLEILEDGRAHFRAGRKKTILLGEGLELRHGLLGGVISEVSGKKRKDLLRISKRYRLVHGEVAQRFGLTLSSSEIPTPEILEAVPGASSSYDRMPLTVFARWKNSFMRIGAEIRS